MRIPVKLHIRRAPGGIVRMCEHEIRDESQEAGFEDPAVATDHPGGSLPRVSLMRIQTAEIIEERRQRALLEIERMSAERNEYGDDESSKPH
jgi:hypothetical protein